MNFGRLCTQRIMTQAEARQSTGVSHLSGHGGDDGGIIGAAAAVGLTASGWSGRFIEYGNLRACTDPVTGEELAAKGSGWFPWSGMPSIPRTRRPHPDE
jgi:hypothetical protein